MPLLTLKNASLAFGHVALLDQADFQLDARERVALIGRNGSGKTSLLRICAGFHALDDGILWQEHAEGISYVAQEPLFDLEKSVFETVASGLGELATLLSDYQKASRKLAKNPENAEFLDQLHAIQSQLDAKNAWGIEARVEEMIDRFALNPEAIVSTLSGGQKKRLALAQALVKTPEVLMLDEPTNHLDIEAISWLEDFLINLPCALIFITHDRRFLDRLATRIVELDRGKLASFPGDFANYQTRKEEMLADELVVAAKFDKFLAEEEVWIRNGVEARRTRNEGRVRRLEALRIERSARRDKQGLISLNVDAGVKSGKLVAELKNVSKSFGENANKINVVEGFSARILRGDKIGLIGKNGSGKTTLLRLILGDLAPDSGSVRLGTKIEIAYFDQFRAALNEEDTLINVISPGSDFVEINGAKKHVISYLEDFLFPSARARSLVKSLSGGEKNRLLLARLFARPANVLVLDEPTNDLDIDTLELLEKLLQEYAGTVFLVSHDRVFLDNVVTQTIASEGDAIWREYVGGYSDFAAWQKENALSKKANAPEKEKVIKPAESLEIPPKKRKRSFNEERELAELPNKIAALEEEQKKINDALENPLFYAEKPKEAAQITHRLGEIEEALLTLLERWEILEAS